MTTTPTTAPRGPVGASRGYAWLLLIGGLIGLAASAVLTLDKLRLLENPAYQPSCNINPIISCGSVMRTAQASAFGFPNPLIGLAAFGALAAVGAGLLAGAAHRRWFWLSLQAGTLLGLGFVAWLIDQTLYEIGALCPYCMVVWAVIITTFWYTTVHNLRTGTLPAPALLRRLAALRFQWLVPTAAYLVIALLILNRFWYYWQTLL
ncbi:vitamin K epoxide reductase family protein [Kitasatospora cineracea]|uniref:Membrane protein n=1 Tax=Kitasatospora cineracea TaxID=88074 RepID=A0A3N4RT39_9ACTN|nr:vitamin K epoxide reductase family protein [Kitasatospora cineracea]RPE36066.1 putative membrane protein [Kitasatospora cineracea]